MIHGLRYSAIAGLIRNGTPPLQAQDMVWQWSFDARLGYFHKAGQIDNPAEDFINDSKRK